MNTQALIPIGLKSVHTISPHLSAYLATELFCRPKRFQRSGIENSFWNTGIKHRLSSGRALRSWGKGPVVFFCHGWESRGSSFYVILNTLSQAGYQVMAWDGPAHGDSPGFRTHIPHYSESLVRDLKELKVEPVAFVGHSFGAASLAIISKLFDHYPKRSVLIGAPANIRNVFNRYYETIQMPAPGQALIEKRIRKEVGYTIDSIGLIENDLSHKGKALWIHDKADKEVPFSDALEVQNSWNQLELFATEGLGHRRILRDPKVAEKIIEFIR